MKVEGVDMLARGKSKSCSLLYLPSTVRPCHDAYKN
jgi:hypothetical protein